MLKLKVLEIKQPFGVFYAAKISAYHLLRIAEADPFKVNEYGEYSGVQRKRNDERLRDIAAYLKGQESALPNSIILAGNSSSENEEGTDIDEWKLVREGENIYIEIKSIERNGKIIDGQHRLNGFKLLSDEEQKEYELLCSIYIDIPDPYQAFLFATINMNQKKVSKSLAYELYGYNLDEENANAWSPEKLSVFLTRRLNLDENSIFHNHIIVAAENDQALLTTLPKNQKWKISTASIVEGFLSLISTNPKRDREKLHQSKANERDRSNLSDDKSPLRAYFKDNNDVLIYEIVNNFFTASHTLLYIENSYIFKTVGIQAQFRVLKEILLNHLETDRDISVQYFSHFLSMCSEIAFDDNFFTASGVGRTRIVNTMLVCMKLKELNQIKNEEVRENIIRLLKL